MFPRFSAAGKFLREKPAGLGEDLGDDPKERRLGNVTEALEEENRISGGHRCSTSSESVDVKHGGETKVIGFGGCWATDDLGGRFHCHVCPGAETMKLQAAAH